MQRAASIILAVGFVVVMLTVWMFNRPTAPRKGGKPPGPLVSQKKKDDDPRAISPFLIPVIAVEIGLLGAMLFVVYRRSQIVPDDGTPRTRCPQCSMKLRYRPEMAGKPGKCPTCKHVFTFPPIEVATV